MTDVYTVLFEEIIAGHYKVNERLKEEEVAQRFGISRTPIREAFRQLSKDGLIEILPRRGSRVIGFTVDDVEEIYEIRKSLELQALRSSAPFLNIQGLKKLREELVSTENESNVARLQDLDARLHAYFIEASGKKRLIALLGQMFRLIQRFRNLGYSDPAVRKIALKGHLELVDSLCVRDLSKAGAILEAHIDDAKRNAISHLVRGT
jgi:DNA-binding GntR family transcriptional regulator